jgi:hypothetical protein
MQDFTITEDFPRSEIEFDFQDKAPVKIICLR